MIKNYLNSLLPWRWTVILFLVIITAPFPLILWGFNGVVVDVVFWILIDIFVGINRSTRFLRIDTSKEERFKNLLEDYLSLQKDYMELTNAIAEYLKRGSTDGAPIRQPMRKKLKKMVGI